MQVSQTIAPGYQRCRLIHGEGWRLDPMGEVAQMKRRQRRLVGEAHHVISPE